MLSSRTVILSLCLAASAAPVAAQSDPVSTVRGLIGNIRALGGHRAAPAATSTAPAAATAALAGAPMPAGAATGPETDLASRPLVKAQPATYDIGGVKLGMSPAEVQRVARQHGLTVSETQDSNLSYDDLVGQKVRVLHGGADFGYEPKRPRVTSYMKLVDPQGSSWAVFFNSVPGGAIVTSVDYTMPFAGRGEPTIAAALADKYGAPGAGTTAVQDGQMFHLAWCGGVRGCSWMPFHDPANMTADGRLTNVRLWLHESEPERIARDNEIARRAQAAAGSASAKVSF